MHTNILQKSEQRRLRQELLKIVFRGLRELNPLSLRSLTLTDLIVVAEIMERLQDLKAAQQVNRAAQNTHPVFTDFLHAARLNAIDDDEWGTSH